MVFVTVPAQRAPALAEHLRQRQVLVLAAARMRLVTHLDVDESGIEHALGAFSGFFGAEAGAPGGIRTHHPWLRRPILRSAELRAPGGLQDNKSVPCPSI